jgi:hypothetical protein
MHNYMTAVELVLRLIITMDLCFISNSFQQASFRHLSELFFVYSTLISNIANTFHRFLSYIWIRLVAQIIESKKEKGI